MDNPVYEDATRVFQGVRFDVHGVELAGRDGKAVQRQVVVHPGAVAILPLLDEQRIVLIRNERFAVGKSLWELPAGTLEAGEEPAATAARELTEETGYRAKSITALLFFYTTPGFCNEAMHAFVASELTHVGQQLDETEQIEVQDFSAAEVMQMIRDGAIVDGKTIATLLYYHTFGRVR